MKKSLFFSILILFVLSTTAFASLSDPNNESEKSALINTRENKLSDEEFNLMTRRTETDNLGKSNLLNKENSNSKNDLKAPQVVVVEGRQHHHGYFIYGGGTLLLIVLLVIILA